MQMRLCRLIGNLSAHAIRFSLVLALAAVLVPSRAMAVTAASATASAAASCVTDPVAGVGVGPTSSLPVSAFQAADTSSCFYSTGSASASAQVTGGSDPTIITSVAASGNRGFADVAQGTLDYVFQIDGATGFVSVTIHGNNSLTTDYADTGGNIISISTSISVGESGEFSNTAGGHIDSTFDVEVGTEIPVYLFARVSIETQCPSGSSSTDDNCGGTVLASAMVDPTFTIPDGYSIVFSPGITAPTAAATPLPAALPLFASGLGGLGLAAWRRKRKKAA